MIEFSVVFVHMKKLKDVVLMWLPEEQQRLPLSSTAVCTALLFVRNSPSLAPTTHTFICYLCIICVVKANSARRRSMYAQAGRRVREERGCKHQVGFCRLAHSASAIVD